MNHGLQGAEVHVARTVAIVGYSNANAGIYRDQVRSLFKDSITISVHRIDNFSRAELERADLVLFTSYDAMRRSIGDVSGLKDVVYATRTVSRAGFDKLLELAAGQPPEHGESGEGDTGVRRVHSGRAGREGIAGTSEDRAVYLVDETLAMAEQMVATLRQAGLAGPRLVPVAEGTVIYRPEDTIVILGEPGYRREAAGRVLDIGNSLLDIPTILDIGFRLGVGGMLNRQNIRESYREIITTNVGLSEVLGMTNRFEGFLDILMQSVDSGIVAAGADGRIFSCNERARQILGLGSGAVVGAPCRSVIPQIPFEAVLREKTPLRDRVVRSAEGEVVFSLDPILHSGVLYGAVAVIGHFGEEERGQHRIRTRIPDRGHRARYTFADIVGQSAGITKCKEMARRMADSLSSVLITGETGTGKEMFAQAIHNASMRRDFQFVAVNCGALPESLLESELFGYEEGAFTGARRGGKPGLFELAHRGTLFLDEIGEMPPDLQMRLLRVLEERQVMRLGGAGIAHLDIRVIAASNRNLASLVTQGRFREDLYYRLAVLPLHIPPVRERVEDILPLISEFRRLIGASFAIDSEVERFLLGRVWRGNARELRNSVEYFANLGAARVTSADLSPILAAEFESGRSVSHPSGQGQYQAQGQGQSPGPEAPSSAPFPVLPATIGTLDVPFREKPGTADPAEGTPGTAAPGGFRCQDASLREFLLERIEKARLGRTRLSRRSLAQEAREAGLYFGEGMIRDALLQLEKEGIVEIRAGRGGTVPKAGKP